MHFSSHSIPHTKPRPGTLSLFLSPSSSFRFQSQISLLPVMCVGSRLATSIPHAIREHSHSYSLDLSCMFHLKCRIRNFVFAFVVWILNALRFDFVVAEVCFSCVG
ncbi:hypothetical protein S245_002613 [Arachis hypogaea]